MYVPKENMSLFRHSTWRREKAFQKLLQNLNLIEHARLPCRPGNRAKRESYQHATKTPVRPSTGATPPGTSSSPATTRSTKKTLPGNVISQRSARYPSRSAGASKAATPPNAKGTDASAGNASSRSSKRMSGLREACLGGPSAKQMAKLRDQRAKFSSPSSSSAEDSDSDNSGGGDRPSAILGIAPAHGKRFDQVCLVIWGITDGRTEWVCESVFATMVVAALIMLVLKPGLGHKTFEGIKPREIRSISVIRNFQLIAICTLKKRGSAHRSLEPKGCKFFRDRDTDKGLSRSKTSLNERVSNQPQRRACGNSWKWERWPVCLMSARSWAAVSHSALCCPTPL